MRTQTRYFILLAVLAVLAYAGGIWQSRRNLVVNNDNQTTAEQKQPSDVEGDGGMATDTAEAPVSEPVLPQLQPVLYSATNTAEAQAVKTINAFELAYNKKNQSDLAAMWSGSDKPVTAIEAAVKEDQSVPISFSFENIEIRSDSTILVTVQEERQVLGDEPFTLRRLFELVPEGNDYKITSYFTPESADITSGFSS